jgi:hypothetical protein
MGGKKEHASSCPRCLEPMPCSKIHHGMFRQFQSVGIHGVGIAGSLNTHIGFQDTVSLDRWAPHTAQASGRVVAINGLGSARRDVCSAAEFERGFPLVPR